MPLVSCRVCRRAFIASGYQEHLGMCSSCYTRLEELYFSSGIHEYLRKNGVNGELDVEKIAAEINMDSRDIRTLINAGFLERDIQTYSKGLSQRQTLADKLEHEIYKKPVTAPTISPVRTVSYGGEKYARKNMDRR